jgi:hypothetical protein
MPPVSRPITLKIAAPTPVRAVPKTTLKIARVKANESTLGRLKVSATLTCSAPPPPTTLLIRLLRLPNKPVELITNQIAKKATIVAMPTARVTRNPTLMADQKSM